MAGKVMTHRVLCAFSFLAFWCSAVSAADRPPNVVLVLVDDLGWKDLSCQGSGFYETPHVDALAAQGMRFMQAYAACAVCSPTRSAVLTGKYPARLGITDWIRPRHSRDEEEYQKSKVGGFVGNGNRDLLTPANRFELDLEETTLAERLKAAGYATCHVGKWHLGDPGHLPTDQGFDRNAGGYDFGQPPSYFDPYTNKKLPEGIPTLPSRKEGEYLAEREADEAVSFIREHKEAPFFLSYWPYEVHTPLQAKADVVEHYKAKPKTEQSNPTYAAMVQGMDEAVGAITAALDELKLANNTLVVFTSDNGGLIGPTNNAPLRSGKGYPYEGGLRVPLIVRWPGVVPKGTTSNVLACSIDLVPTICEAVGRPVAQDTLDGISLWKHISSGGKTPVDRDTLLWHFPHYRQQDVVPYSVLRSGDWKLIKRYEGPAFELFNLADDPEEKHDLASEQPDRVKALDKELMDSLQAAGARIPKPKARISKSR
jgi:arylsulfatase A-like enzyme